MNDLQFALLLLGSLAIGGVLAHGVWTLRRQKKPKINQRFKYRKKAHVKLNTHVPEPLSASSCEDEIVNDSKDHQDKVAIKAEAPDMLDPKVEPEIDLFECEPYTRLNTDKPLASDPETVLDQMSTEGIEEVQEDTPSRSLEVQEISDILVLHIKAPAQHMLSGSALLSSLLDLGLKHGEMGIFHRHRSPSGTGEIMFSVVNMAAPGVFSIADLNDQKLHGVSLFMKLPCGQALMKFSLMLNAASQLADDLNAQLLDDQHKAWTAQAKKDYLQRLKEFTHIDADVVV